MKKYISIFAIAGILLSACGKDGKDPAPVMSEIAVEGAAISEGRIVSGPEGGSFQVNVTSSAEWRVSGISDWVEVSPVSGASGATLTFTVAPNATEEGKTATFKVFSGDAVTVVTVVSTPSYRIVLDSDDAFTVGSDASSFTVKVESNVNDIDIDYGDASGWVSLSDVSDVFGKKIFRFNVDRSKEFKARTGVISFKADGVEDEVSVTLTQAQRDTAFVAGEQRIIKGLEAMDIILDIKSNIDVIYSLPAWLSETDSSSEPMDETTGLQTKHVSLHADACSGSRASTIQFKKSSTVYGYVYIKQQNPNPVFANIPDPNLRSRLDSDGWIIADETGACEILETGLTATSLTLGSTSASSYSTSTMDSIEGLEAFPALESLTLGSITVKKVDVSAYPALKTLKLINLRYVEEVNTGSRPITDVTNTSGSYTYTNVPSIVIKGENIENVNFSSTSYYIGYGYEEDFESIDVTGCPALKTLNVNRKASSSWYSGASSLKYVYMTTAQIASVTVTKQDSVEIVEK